MEVVDEAAGVHCPIWWHGGRLALGARSQQRAMLMIGFLGSASPEMRRNQLAAFHRSLNEAGYVEGRNLAIEYRYAEVHYDRLTAFARRDGRRWSQRGVCGQGGHH
jgi:hypothetical protein